jgi:hypothetical protein
MGQIGALGGRMPKRGNAKNLVPPHAETSVFAGLKMTDQNPPASMKDTLAAPRQPKALTDERQRESAEFLGLPRREGVALLTRLSV